MHCKGAYATVAMIIGSGIVGFRDGFGIRPLVYGRRRTDIGFDYMIASESVALDILGFELVADVSPGEAIFISNDGQVYTQQCAQEVELVPCIFEHVYFARPDSIIDDVSVYKSRLRMGEYLAQNILSSYSQNSHDIDVVVPVPDTGRTSALPLAHMLDVKFREGFVKNRYIGRTFIMPKQEVRKKSVRRKLNILDLEFQGKNVLLVDDSIVRGHTSKKIIELVKRYGNTKIGIQLAHAGRKASTQVPWKGGTPLNQDNSDSWQTVAPSSESYNSNWPLPIELNEEGLEYIKKCFVKSAKRAVEIGFDIIELHMAHGYLIHQFLSPISNKRKDKYGSCFENRIRYPLEIFKAIREEISTDYPVGVRFSATDWVENSSSPNLFDASTITSKIGSSNS